MAGKKITEESLRLNIIINGDAARKALLDQERLVKDQTKALHDLEAQQKSLAANGDTGSQKFKKLTKAIEDQNKTLKESREKLETLRRQQSLTTMTLDELRKHSQQLRTALSKAVPGTENYKKLAKELQQTRRRTAELEREIRNTDKTLCSMADRFKDYAISFAALVSAGRSIYSWVEKATDAYKEQDEAMTDVIKTTGLTREEVSSLNEELKKLDTRTAQNELLSLARIGGKLGITGEQNLLAFVSAADKINVALKEDLGGDAEGAIATVGKLVDIFQLEGAYGLEDALLKTGSAINELGMASTANEGYIVDFTSRLAGLAPNADISISKILGLGATLDKYGQQAETAGTAIGQTIMAMFKRTETFAEIAKMPLQEFSDLLNKDVNEALLRVLEGMNDGGGLSTVVTAMEAMHLNGQRASTILGTLSKNTEELRTQQELAAEAFERGTSLQEEFNTKNTSATAIAEKHKKAIEEQVVAIGQKLLPVADGAMRLSEVGLKLISGLVSVMIKYKVAIMAVAAAYAGYNAVKAIAIAHSKIQALRVNDVKKALASEVLSLGNATKSTIALSAAKNLLAGNFKAAGMAVKAFFKAVAAGTGPVGWIIAAAAALGTILVNVIGKSRESTKALRELNEQTQDTTSGYTEAITKIDAEKEALEDLKAAAINAAAGSNERARAIKNINEKYGDYLPNLLSEKSSNEDIETALKGVNDELERKILLQAKEQELVKIHQHKTDSVKALLTDANTLSQQKRGKGLSPAETKTLTEEAAKYYDAMMKGDGETFFSDALPGLSSALSATGGTPKRIGKIREAFNDAIQSGQQLQAVVDGLFKDVEPSDKLKPLSVNPDPNPDLDPTTSPDGGGGSEDDKLKELEALIKESQKIIEDGNKDAIDAETKRYETEKAKFEASKDDLIAAGIDYNALLEQLEATHQAKLSQIEVKALDDRRKLIEQSHKLERTQAENNHIEELDLAIRNGEDVTALKEKHAKELADIDMKYALQLQDVLDEVVNTDGIITLDIEGLTVEELNALKQKLEEIRALRNELSGTTGTPTASGESGGSDDSGTSEESGKNGTMLGLNAEQWEELFAAGTDGWERMSLAATAFGEAANIAMDITAKAMQRQSKLEQKALKEFQKNNDKKKADLESRLNSGLITEAQYNASIQAMDAEYEAYQEQLALKQAKREKALSLTQAIINTAMGVTKALASMAPPLNFVNAGIVAAMGAAEIALIASTPITTDGAEEGGDIFAKRNQDGKIFSARLSPKKRGLVSSPTILVGENGAEYVIPNDGIKNPTLLPIIESIDNARRAGTLASLDFRSVYSPAVVSQGFSVGGYTSGIPAGPTTTVQQAATATDIPYEKFLQLLEEISALLKQPTPAIVSMLGPQGFVKAFEKYEKMKKNGQA